MGLRLYTAGGPRAFGGGSVAVCRNVGPAFSSGPAYHCSTITLGHCRSEEAVDIHTGNLYIAPSNVVAPGVLPA